MQLRTHRQRGILLLVVLVCLALVTVLAGVWLRMVAIERQQARSQQFALQADYLADSAIQRAKAQLESNAEYQGETWELTADALGMAVPAKVFIEVVPGNDNGQARSIRVSAELAGKGPSQVLRRRQRTILLSTKEPTS